MDRRVKGDGFELAQTERAMTANRFVLRHDVLEGARDVGREDHVHDMLARECVLRRDRIDQCDRPLELHVGLDAELLAQLAPKRLDQRLAAVDAAAR
jgi:hypothetical protein